MAKANKLFQQATAGQPPEEQSSRATSWMSTNNGTWTGPGDAENSQQQQPAALPFSVPDDATSVDYWMPETSRSPEKEREQQPAQEYLPPDAQRDWCPGAASGG